MLNKFDSRSVGKMARRSRLRHGTARIRHGTARHECQIRAVPRVFRAVPIRVPWPIVSKEDTARHGTEITLDTARHGTRNGTARNTTRHGTGDTEDTGDTFQFEKMCTALVVRLQEFSRLGSRLMIKIYFI